MKKSLLTVVSGLLAASLLAATEVEQKMLTPEEIAQKQVAARARMQKSTGGIIIKEGEGQIAFVNCQKKVSEADIKARAELLQKMLNVKVEVVPCPESASVWDSQGLAAGMKSIQLPKDTVAQVYVVDTEKIPTLSLVAVEAGWGVVNVRELTPGKQTTRELNRVAVMVFGGFVSQFKASPMQTVRSPEDLDKLVGEGITFDAVQAMMRNLQGRGVTPMRRTTYRRACEEGWAPAPTNEYQKVIWEKIKAEQSEKPSNPLRIQPGDKPLSSAK